MRIITDMIRTEDNGDGRGLQVNTQAGYQITAYVRRYLPNIPILVVTAPDYIQYTQFVQSFWLTGSTSDYSVVQEYIDQLAGRARENYSVKWACYNAQSSWALYIT